MPARLELVSRMVLYDIADDYENVDQCILRHVSDQARQLGWAVDRSEVVEALRTLIQAGHAKAYLLSPFAPAVELAGMPSLDVIEDYFETYFYITKAGMDALKDGMEWPFDDLHDLRGGA
jgi:hypothetical protein